MLRVMLRFYAELNDLLPLQQRYKDNECKFIMPESVKHVIESIGIPHTEVDLILVNGYSVGFDYRLQDGDRISVYPVFESVDVTPLQHLRPEALRHPQFVLDTHLGRLVAYLRMLGFDSLYNNQYRDEELVDISQAEHRIILTRDRGVLKRKQVTHGYFVRNIHTELQLAEVIERFDLRNLVKPFIRCLRCNGLLQKLTPDEARDRIPIREISQRFTEFCACPDCGGVFWKGSHYDRMLGMIERVYRNMDGQAHPG